MDMQEPKKHPGALQTSIHCALAVIGFAFLVLAIYYFPEEWVSKIGSSWDKSGEEFLVMINALVVPVWLVLVAVCVHLWATCVLWKLRGYAESNSNRFVLFLKSFKDWSESSALLLIALFAHLEGMVTSDVVILLVALIIAPRFISLFFCGMNPARYG